MSVAKNNSVAKSRKTASFVQPFETLENRQMMSASVPHIPALLPADSNQPAILANHGHAKQGHANAGHAAHGRGVIGVVTPPIRTNVFSVLPVVNTVTTTTLPEPKVDWSTEWKNFSSN